MTTMTDDEFEGLLEAYGAAPHRWPEPRREAALALLAGSAAAQRAQRRAERLDGWLDRLGGGEDAAAVDRIVAAATAAVRDLPPSMPAARRRLPAWLPAGVVSGALAAGIAVGLVIHPAPQAAAGEESASVTSLVLAPGLLSAMMDAE